MMITMLAEVRKTLERPAKRKDGTPFTFKSVMLETESDYYSLDLARDFSEDGGLAKLETLIGQKVEIVLNIIKQDRGFGYSVQVTGVQPVAKSSPVAAVGSK